MDDSIALIGRFGRWAEAMGVDPGPYILQIRYDVDRGATLAEAVREAQRRIRPAPRVLRYSGKAGPAKRARRRAFAARGAGR